jgi:hypothetical protein
MKPGELYPIITVLLLITVEYGGWALLGLIVGRAQLDEARQRFFRAGHAHAGVLLTLSLVYFLYFARADLSTAVEWIAGAMLLAGVLAQAGGFFLHMAAPDVDRPSKGTTMTRVGALLIAAALVILAVGLIRAA